MSRYRKARARYVAADAEVRELGRAAARALVAENLTYREAAERLGVSKQRIHQWLEE